jgi:hypothetical protein
MKTCILLKVEQVINIVDPFPNKFILLWAVQPSYLKGSINFWPARLC